MDGGVIQLMQTVDQDFYLTQIESGAEILEDILCQHEAGFGERTIGLGDRHACNADEQAAMF